MKINKTRRHRQKLDDKLTKVNSNSTKIKNKLTYINKNRHKMDKNRKRVAFHCFYDK